MIASDTRLTRGFNILSRDQGKVLPLTAHTMMASSGCWADVLTLSKVLQDRITVSVQHQLVIKKLFLWVDVILE